MFSLLSEQFTINTLVDKINKNIIKFLFSKHTILKGYYKWWFVIKIDTVIIKQIYKVKRESLHSELFQGKTEENSKKQLRPK